MTEISEVIESLLVVFYANEKHTVKALIPYPVKKLKIQNPVNASNELEPKIVKSAVAHNTITGSYFEQDDICFEYDEVVKSMPDF